MISSQGMEKSLLGFKRELFPMFKLRLRRGGQDIPSFHKQRSSIPFISVCNNGQYPYMGTYNTAPHSKRKQHTPSWPPAMTLPQQSPPNHRTGRLWNAALLHNTLPAAPDLLQSHQEPASLFQVWVQTNHQSIYPNLKQFNLIN